MNKEEKKLTLAQLKKRSLQTPNGKKNFDAVLSDLKAGFMRDFTDEESCHYAGISKDTYYRWRAISDEFCEVIDVAKTWLFRKAKQNLVDAVEAHSVDESKWLLQKRQKNLYSDRVEQTGKDGEAIQHEVDLSNYKEKLKEKTDEELQRIIGEQVRASSKV